MAKYLDSTGLNYLAQKIKTLLAGKADSGHNHDSAYLKLTGGSVTGPLTINEDIIIDSDKSFYVNKTLNGVAYRSYIKPIAYSVGNNGNYSTGLIHYQNGTSVAQMMFNQDGVMLRDNVASKAYQLFGQHNTATTAAGVRSHLYTYGTTDMTAGTSALDTGKLYFCHEA